MRCTWNSHINANVLKRVKITNDTDLHYAIRLAVFVPVRGGGYIEDRILGPRQATMIQGRNLTGSFVGDTGDVLVYVLENGYLTFVKIPPGHEYAEYTVSQILREGNPVTT
jgi:hypothetical protein